MLMHDPPHPGHTPFSILTAARLVMLIASLVLSSAVLAQGLLPTHFERNRLFVTATAPDGEEIRFYTDTGGGFNAIAESVTARYSLPKRGSADAGKESYELVAFPTFVHRSGIPAPEPDPWLRGHLAVVADERLESDGFLGSRWFAGRIWKFDYPGQALSLLDASDIPSDFEAITLGFRTDDSGDRDLNFPRITIRVNGEPLEMLLDTGATAQLAESAAIELGLPAGTRVATSYIIRSKFEQWRDRHPDWNVIESAEVVTGRAYPMIEVPDVEVGGLSVGPVWFSVRPDDTFKNFMTQMMDQQIVGAVGGSLLKYFHMIIDYPGARAHFRVGSDAGRDQERSVPASHRGSGQTLR